MKIQCSTCAARYAIADEKVLGRNVAVRCKRCGERIAIQGAAEDWHVARDGVTEGPLSLGAVLSRIDRGEIGADAHVWREGMESWAPASEAPELAARFEAVAASEPPAEPASEERGLTGGRRETSVLFSLSNLRELSRGAEASAPSATTTEGSGLIDIRALAETTFAAAPAPAPEPDELLAFGGAGLGSPLGAPVVLPERRGGSSHAPIVIGSAVALCAALAAAAVVVWVETRPAPVPPATAMADEGPIVAPETPTVGAIEATEAPSAPTAVAPAVDEPPPVAEAPPVVEAPTSRVAPRPRPTPRAPVAEVERPAPTRPVARPTAPSEDPLARIFDEPSAPATTAPPARRLPATPSRGDVVTAMRGLEAPVRACGEGAHGMATVRFSFGSNGRVQSATVDGDVPPAVRSCVARAARAASVPEFSRDTFAVTYPFRF